MGISNEKRKELENRYTFRKALLEDLIDVCDEIMNGVPESTACYNHKIKTSEFRRLFDRNIYYNNTSEVNMERNKDQDLYLFWEDQLVSAIFGSQNMHALPDFNKAYEKAKLYLDDDSIQILEMYFIKSMTFRRISKELGVDPTTVRHRLAVVLRRLRTPKISNLFRYGCDIETEIQDYDERINAGKQKLVEKQHELQKLNVSLKELEQMLRCIHGEENAVSGEVVSELLNLRSSLINDTMNLSLDELDLNNRAYNALRRSGIRTVNQLYNLTEEELYSIRNLGGVTVRNIITSMKSLGFTNFPRKKED